MTQKVVKSNNTTRDSGFGDSLAEDTSNSSTLAAAKNVPRTEHSLDVIAGDEADTTDIVLTTKVYPDEKSKLKSVEEDIDVITPVSGRSRIHVA